MHQTICIVEEIKLETYWYILSSAGVSCHLLVYPVTCWCILSPAGVSSHMLVYPLTCWCILSPAGVSSHLLVYPLTCWCILSPAGVVFKSCNPSTTTDCAVTIGQHCSVCKYLFFFEIVASIGGTLGSPANGQYSSLIVGEVVHTLTHLGNEKTTDEKPRNRPPRNVFIRLTGFW